MQYPTELSPIFDANLLPDEKTWAEKFAQLISRVFSPPILVAVGVFWVALALDSVAGWWWSGFYLVMGLLIPVAYIVWKVRVGELTDFHMRLRAQRIKPMSISLACSLTAFALMITGGAPDVLIILAAMGVLQVGFLLLVTLRWKISGHSTAITGWAVFLVAIFGKIALPALVMIPLVAWARVRLNRHELGQTIAGSLAGLVFILITLYLVAVSTGWELQI